MTKMFSRIHVYFKEKLCNRNNAKPFDWSVLEDKEVLHALQTVTTMHDDNLTDEEITEVKRLIAKLEH